MKNYIFFNLRIFLSETNRFDCFETILYTKNYTFVIIYKIICFFNLILKKCTIFEQSLAERCNNTIPTTNKKNNKTLMANQSINFKNKFEERRMNNENEAEPMGFKSDDDFSFFENNYKIPSLQVKQ